MRCGKDGYARDKQGANYVATRTNALWQRAPMIEPPIFASSQPARMRCGKGRKRRPVPLRRKSQPARMRCGKAANEDPAPMNPVSQPARMRCGKDPEPVPYVLRDTVATRTNALWQRPLSVSFKIHAYGRNPHECAVAKVLPRYVSAAFAGRNPHECAVAKLVTATITNRRKVATRTNALWQRLHLLGNDVPDESQPARMRCGKDFYHQDAKN